MLRSVVQQPQHVEARVRQAQPLVHRRRRREVRGVSAKHHHVRFDRRFIQLGNVLPQVINGRQDR